MISANNHISFLGIIPARYASTRFPGKPLADIGGKPMIQHVYEQAKKTLDRVVVATDDNRIFDAVKAFRGEAIMTSDRHKSGTDRCFEAFTNLKQPFDVIINIQGDEPFVKPEHIESLKECFQKPSTQIATLVKPFSSDDNFELLFNSNSPKVVLNHQQEALYFSRSVIPYIRNFPHTEWLKNQIFYKHIGMYAYKADVLEKITQLTQSSLEIAESLEQLRWLENGFRIQVGIVNFETIAVDTPEDLEKAREYYALHSL
ncbi:3-deoxy-manno-octulosonate cytidylyltransferase (CMP-KDO synthetase) [Microbacter margulisiae]|uniref:3-deoxy-manno-octulosonate cytidylyltransferase n=1 Tax=Microbacter margulisiae TaxID=1350067 RepID=A0A7W5DR06_9PORP|nr:3-deoxy-manno-octulosonate cytidylyltransferase [Microbacter margulisiae]MBB3187495.1 3-deoxy-manno-octulosonate cytidylyltransferase (CMP-KDO synthetase) [Microbacter margulisiae]